MNLYYLLCIKSHIKRLQVLQDTNLFNFEMAISMLAADHQYQYRLQYVFGVYVVVCTILIVWLLLGLKVIRFEINPFSVNIGSNRVYGET